jgi:hypothetical protein
MKFFSRKPTPQDRKIRAQAKEPVVKEAARQALRKYEKTFIDLARYDRGETIRISQ